MKDKEKQIFDKYGNYDFPTETKHKGLNSATTQIEEMAKDLKENLRLCAGVKLLDHQVETIAYELSKKYQPKLPKDSVVLPCKHYILANKVYSDTTLKSWKKEELIKHIRILEHNWAGAEERLNNQANWLSNKVVHTQEELENMVNMANVQIKCITDIAINASKETAERDFNHIIKALEIKKASIITHYGVKESVGADVAIRTVKELAKQFGVEVDR